MKRTERGFRNSIRRALRPIAQFARTMLTPPEPPPEFVWHTIESGPAAGAQALLPEGSWLSEAIVTGSFEKQVIDVLQALIRTDDRCFDVGGHYGYHTLCLARLAHAGRVDTFEPVPAHADRIRKAIERSGISNATVYPEAIAEEAGDMSMCVAGQDGDDSMGYLEAYGGVATDAANQNYPKFSRIAVQAVTLDSLLETMPAPTFLKIDAEGAEAPILRGGRNLIARHRPRLLVELHGIVEALTCAEFLRTLDYRAIVFAEQKVTMPVLFAPREDEEAVSRVASVLGRTPTILLDDSRGGAESL